MKINWMYFVDKYYNKTPRFRRLITRFRFQEKDISINLFNTKLFINTIRENGYMRAHRMCRTNSLLRDEVSVLANISILLRSGDSFVDVGANVGIFSSFLSRYTKVFSDFRIYAFEAHPDTYERLKKNSLMHNFSAQNLGISDRDDVLEFVDGAVSHVFTTIENASVYNILDEVIQVKCKRLDELDIKGNSIILKIDVEGQELNVLEGASAFFEDKRIKAVYLDGFSNKNEVLNFLKSFNFSFLDGRTLEESDGNIFSLLALSREKKVF